MDLIEKKLRSEEGVNGGRWRYWIVYKWTVFGLWLVQLAVLAADVFPDRGNNSPYRARGLSLLEDMSVFLTVGVGATLIISLILSLVWAFAILRILRIGQGAD